MINCFAKWFKLEQNNWVAQLNDDSTRLSGVDTAILYHQLPHIIIHNYFFNTAAVNSLYYQECFLNTRMVSLLIFEEFLKCVYTEMKKK